VYSAAWRYETTRGCKLKGDSRVSMQTCNNQQRVARMRGIRVRSVVPKLIANGESHALERGSPQLGVSGLGSHVAAKRAGAERREADFCWRATAKRSREKNHSRERDEGRRRGKGMCAPCDAEVPAGSVEESTYQGADSIYSVCEGGAVCACSDRTDAR